jgi:Uma2 family endonuclease
LVTEELYASTKSDPPRKRWTRAECEAFERAGLLDWDRYELIEGELITKTPKNVPHQRALMYLQFWLRQVFGWEFVYPGGSMEVSIEDNETSLPEPDLVVLRKPVNELADPRPRPEDVQLLIEVADTTFGFDLTAKAALYARAGIPDYWVLDIKGRRLIVHRDPREGTYQSITLYNENESVRLLSADAEFPVKTAFPEKKLTP